MHSSVIGFPFDLLEIISAKTLFIYVVLDNFTQVIIRFCVKKYTQNLKFTFYYESKLSVDFHETSFGGSGDVKVRCFAD